MTRLACVFALALALAACGGADSGPGGAGSGGERQFCRHYGGGEGCSDIAPGVWEEDGQICATYRPHPRSVPTYERTDCVPADWPHGAFCWVTDDELECSRDDNVSVGCLLLEDDPATGITAGNWTWGCTQDRDCHWAGIDNADCCEHRDDSRGAWDCGEP